MLLMLMGLLLGQPAGGHLILIGGGKRPQSVMTQFFNLAGGAQAPILIVPTASELADTGDFYTQQFKQDFGCQKVSVADVKTRADADRPEVVALFATAGGVFFAGGDQSRITQAFLGSESLRVLRERYEKGGLVILGTSAGTACMSDWMLTGNGEFDRITAQNVEVVQGLGLVPHLILDQHFVARSRQNRLISVVLEHPNLIGVGIDEATALWIQPSGRMEVIGEGWVQIYDARSALITQQQRGESIHLGAKQINMHILQPGDAMDPREKSLILP